MIPNLPQNIYIFTLYFYYSNLSIALQELTSNLQRLQINGININLDSINTGIIIGESRDLLYDEIMKNKILL